MKCLHFINASTTAIIVKVTRQMLILNNFDNLTVQVKTGNYGSLRGGGDI